MPQTVLVTGASGLLGRDVLKAFQRDGWNAVGTGLTRAKPPAIVKLDLLNTDNIKAVLDEVKPDVIVHCAANRFPDSCSNDPSAAAAINVESTRSLTSEAKARNALLIYISTDYVFSGRPGEAPYKTTDKADPPNVYGQTKFDGEQAVLSESEAQGKIQAVILRVPVLYGHCDENDTGKSAIHPMVDSVWQAQKVKDGEAKIKVDDYALRYPTNTADVARVLVDVSKLYLKQQDGSAKQLPQILQFSSEDKYTKYEIANLFGQEILGLPVDNLERHDPTKDVEAAGATQRPYDSHLDISVLKELGVDVSTQDFVGWWRRELRAFRH